MMPFVVDWILIYRNVPNSNLLGIKRFAPSTSISFKCECFIVMQIQHTKNLNPERFELGTSFELAELVY